MIGLTNLSGQRKLWTYYIYGLSGRMHELQQTLQDFQDDRPTMKEANTLPFLLRLLRQEIDEFEESPTGDEMADILIFSLTIANLMGIDADAEVREKIAFNLTRYQARYFQSGNYEESRQKVKEEEKAWKDDFYSI